MIDGRRLMMASRGGGSGAQVVTGSFTGDGSNTSPQLSCGFYPDAIICHLDANTVVESSFVGSLFDVIVRNINATAIYDQNTTTTNVLNYSTPFTQGMQNYSESTYITRGLYALVDGANITLKHNTGSNDFGKFVNGCTYHYTFIKYATD